MKEFQKTKLKNGLTVITCEMPQTLSVAISVFVKAGSRYENKSNKGLAHFLEHIAFKGSKKYPSQKEISEIIERYGGYINAYTAKEVIAYQTHLPAKYFKIGFKVLADIIQNPLLDQKEIDKEKGVVIEELNHYNDLPDSLAYLLFGKIAYPNHPLGWNQAGEKSILKKIKRKDFENYLKSLFTPSNMVIVIAGKGKKEKWLKVIKESFSQMKDKKTIKFVPFKENQKSQKLASKYKKTEQSHLVLGFKSLSKKESLKGRATLRILNIILGGALSSRLSLKIRDELGLAYVIYSQFLEFQESGIWLVYAGLNNKNVLAGIKAIAQEFKKIKKESISKAELEKAKEFLKGRMILQNESTFEIVSFYGEQAALEPQIKTIKEVLKIIDQISPKDIQKLAKKLFVNKNLNLALVGPVKNTSEIKKLLVLD